MLEGFSGSVQVGLEQFPPMPTCAKRRFWVRYLTGGSKDVLVVDDANIRGVEASITPSRRNWGSIYSKYMSGDMMRTVHEVPQVQVIVNQIPASCNELDACDFRYRVDLTPLVESATRTSGRGGDDLLLRGARFSANASLTSGNISVVIGGFPCDVVNATDAEIFCRLGLGFGGPFGISVTVAGAGAALHVGSRKNLTYDSEATSMTPMEGGTGGGEKIEIRGFGFQNGVRVDLGRKRCRVVFVNYTLIECLTPKGEDGLKATASISQWNEATKTWETIPTMHHFSFTLWNKFTIET